MAYIKYCDLTHTAPVLVSCDENEKNWLKTDQALSGIFIQCSSLCVLGYAAVITCRRTSDVTHNSPLQEPFTAQSVFMSTQSELWRHKELRTTARAGHCDWSEADSIMCGVRTWLAASPGTYMWRNMLIWKWNGNRQTKGLMPSIQDGWKYDVVELSCILFTCTLNSIYAFPAVAQRCVTIHIRKMCLCTDWVLKICT